MKSIEQRERELFQESWILRGASFETVKAGKSKKNYEKSRELQKRQDEVYKRQQFYLKYIKEMEKRKNE